MGSALGRLLLTRVARVVSTLEGRSDRSAQLCRAAGLEVLGSVTEVVKQADVLVSAVAPAAAMEVAERVAAARSVRSGQTLYIDVNSVSPVTMLGIKSVLDRHNVEVVDGTIHGLASRLTAGSTLYLSGERAGEVAALFGAPPRTVVLGRDVGRASLMKMLMGGVSKGLVALLLELSDVALQQGVLDEFWEELRTIYPGVMDPFARLLPTYPRHVGRRREEMAELELTVSAAGKQAIMATAIHTVLERSARSRSTMETLAERIVPFGPRENDAARDA